MKILFTGGTGLLGSYLIPYFSSKGHEIINLSRKAGVVNGIKNEAWDGKKIPDHIGPVDVIINLAGAAVADARWTDSRKKLILESRIDASKACVDFIKRSEKKPRVFISCSGTGYYGVFPLNELDENSPAGNDFLAQVCVEWEKSSQGSGVRTVNPRISMVLAKEGGALKRLLPLYRWCIGGTIASGRQGVPWIHIKDLVKAFEFFLEKESVSGPVNLCASEIINNKQFSKAIGAATRRPSFFWVPKLALRTVFGEMSYILWGGQFVKPGVLKREGFVFDFPTIKGAMEEIVNKS